jgi:hypothetical protein
MKKISITDFSGGIQEAYSPDDFTQRQSSVLKGFIPKDVNTFQSQWPCQSLSAVENQPAMSGLFPLESSVGTFLVGISTDGRLYFTKVPPTNAVRSSFNCTWTEITDSETYGYSSTGAQVQDTAKPHSDYRFLTGLSLEVYKYVKEPLSGSRQVDFTQDQVPSNLDSSGSPQETFLSRAKLPAVLISARRQLRGNTFEMWESGLNVPLITGTRVMVAFVDPRGTCPDYDGVGTSTGAVRMITFPHIRRWPTYTRNYSATNANGTPIETWPQVVIGGETYGAEERAFAIKPVVPTKAQPTGDTTTGFVTDFYTNSNNKYPDLTQWFHPYTYKDIASALLPGSGIIPRGNVGCMWGEQLIIGDIEWRSDRAIDATSSKKVNTPQNSALLYLNDGNTEYHRGSIYYSEDDIDKFDPRHVIAVSTGEARVAGMHMLDNRMICVTSAAGPFDGVVALSGNLGQLLPYTGTPNPYAVRRQLIRGGVGVADRSEFDQGHRTQTCLWSETGSVVFVDITGAIYYTDGVMLDRLDRYGPKQPAGSTMYDHVASVGKHLIAYRDDRLLCLTVLESNGGVASGCWTELVRPNPSSGAGSIRSMVGSGNQLFLLVDNIVFRYVIDGPVAEYGCVDGDPRDLTFASATLGDPNGHVKTNWHRVGLSFFTPNTATIKTCTVKAEAELLPTSPTPSPNANPVPTYTKTLDDTYSNGHYNVVVPAGIGPQTVASVKFVMRGNVILQGLSLWVSGGFAERGEKP